MLAVSSRCSDTMLSASRGTRGLAFVVIKKDGADRSTVELMSRKLVEVTDLLLIHVTEAAYPDSKGISSLIEESMVVHRSRTAAVVSLSSDLGLTDVDRCGGRRGDEESRVSGVRLSGSSLQPLIIELSEMSVTYRYASAISDAAVGPMV